jgi:hypothetical protein
VGFIAAPFGVVVEDVGRSARVTVERTRQPSSPWAVGRSPMKAGVADLAGARAACDGPRATTPTATIEGVVTSAFE